jgi:hypothetical protein
VDADPDLSAAEPQLCLRGSSDRSGRTAERDQEPDVGCLDLAPAGIGNRRAYAAPRLLTQPVEVIVVSEEERDRPGRKPPDGECGRRKVECRVLQRIAFSSRRSSGPGSRPSSSTSIVRAPW